MSVQLNSYVHFTGNAREALEFYKTVFGGEAILRTFAQYESPQMSVAPEDREKIMHGYLKGDNGIELMASDAPSSMPQPDTGSRVSLTVSGDDKALLHGYWDKLSEGAAVTVSLAQSPWDDTFGMLTDKYGVVWMVDIGNPAR